MRFRESFIHWQPPYTFHLSKGSRTMDHFTLLQSKFSVLYTANFLHGPLIKACVGLADVGDIQSRLLDHRPVINAEIRYFVKEFEVLLIKNYGITLGLNIVTPFTTCFEPDPNQMNNWSTRFGCFMSYLLYINLFSAPLLLFRRNVDTERADCWKTLIKWCWKQMSNCSSQISRPWPSSWQMWKSFVSPHIKIFSARFGFIFIIMYVQHKQMLTSIFVSLLPLFSGGC